MRVRLGNKRLVRSASVEASKGPNSDKTRKTRHCCSVTPVSANMFLIGFMTPSRARMRAIGNERDVEGSFLLFMVSSLVDVHY
jgi:hypothetical protein